MKMKGMKIRRMLWFGGVLFFLGCSSTRELHKLKPTGQIALPVKNDAVLNTGQVEKIIVENSADKEQNRYVSGSYTADGELLAEIQMNEIQIVAPSRRVAERSGKVLIEFLIDVPELLFRKDYQLALFPKLISNDSLCELRPVVLNGNEFRGKQEKQYQAYERYAQTVEKNVSEGPDKFLNKRMFSKYLERKAFLLEKENVRVRKAFSAHLLSEQKLRERDMLFGKTSERTPREFAPRFFPDLLALLPYAKETRMELLSQALLRGGGPVLRKVTSADSLHAYNLFYNKRKFESNEKKLARLDQTFGKIVEYPIYENAYLDTIVNRGRHKINYLYSLEADESSPKMYLSLDGAVTAVDGSTYHFKAQDTLTYFVSSMTMFIDRAPRFKRHINLRRVQAEMSANLLFPVGKTDVIDTLAGNRQELEKLKGFYRDLTSNKDLLVDSIVIKAGSSPEGPWRMNDRLSRERASKAADFLAGHFPENKELRKISKPYSLAENWALLDTLLVGDTLLNQAHRKEIRELIASNPDPDDRESVIKQRYPLAYKTLTEVYYPNLRSISFMFHLHRVGFARDTVYTNEPDTEYARGIELLEKRKYKDALEILKEYADVNTAVAHMSLGHDTQALAIMSAQKPTADVDYMLAILYLRTGNQEQALRHYQKACEADPSKVFRGNLDPEIQKLKTVFNIE